MIFITNEKEIKNYQEIAGIYFYSQDLHFHRKMKIMIERAEEAQPNITFFAVDVDFFSSLPPKFDVISIPEIVFLDKNKKNIGKIKGIKSTSEFMSRISSIYLKSKD